MTLTGEPRVRGTCHCGDCRTLLDVPFHAVTAWDADQVAVTRGAETLSHFKHPDLTMAKVFCPSCGEVLYNTNKMDWRVVSQLLIAKNMGGEVPEDLRSLSHFFYGRRIIDIDDDLPKKD